MSQYPGHQPGDIDCIIQPAMLLPLSADPAQRARSDHAHFLADALGFRKQSLGILVGHGQGHCDPVALGVPGQLLVIVVSPAHPDGIGRHHVVDEGPQRLRGDGKQWCLIHFFLRDADQLLAKWCEYRSRQRPDQVLKPLKHHTTFGGPAGADFNDFHLFRWDAAVIRTGRFQVDYENSSHMILLIIDMVRLGGQFRMRNSLAFSD